MAYDVGLQRVVLFGGVSSETSLGDTWSWDGAFWTQLADVGPAARSGHAMAYDVGHRQIVLFGGADGAARFGDTWIWDGVAWTQVAEAGPTARAEHAMAYDSARSLIVLFGGTDVQDLSDTWVWDGAAWTQRENRGPGARHGHVMAYDTGRDRLVLFGGARGDQVLDDTWEWDGSVWRQVAEFGAPAGVDSAMTHDMRGPLLFGGVGSTTAGGEGRDSTWAWEDGVWAEVQHYGPPGRGGHAAVFDTTRHRVVVFGGLRRTGVPGADSLLGDTWECPGRESTLLSVAVSPTQIAPGNSITVEVRLTDLSSESVPVQVAAVPGTQAGGLNFSSTVLVAAGNSLGSATVMVPLGTPSDTYTLTATGTGVIRRTFLTVLPAAVLTRLRIVAVLPDPVGPDVQAEEEVHLVNDGTTSGFLSGWQITDALGRAWLLDESDGQPSPGQVVIVRQRRRSMALANAGGVVRLVNPAGEIVDSQSYGAVAEGQLIRFD